MDYNKLKEIAKKKKKSMSDLAEIAEMSTGGFYQAISANSLRVDTLEKIAEGLGVPVSDFFDDRTEEAQAAYVTQTGKGYNINQTQTGSGNKQNQNVGATSPTKPFWPTDLSACIKELWERDKRINLLQQEVITLQKQLMGRK